MSRDVAGRPLIAAVAALFLLNAATVPAEDARRFRYDETSGRCLDALGAEGLNPPAPSGTRNECADFRGRVVLYFNAEGGDFRGADFDRAQFRYLNLFAGADLTGARLTKVVGAMIDLTGADLTNADLTGANLSACTTPGAGACLTGARYDARTKLPFPDSEASARGMLRVPTPRMRTPP